MNRRHTVGAGLGSEEPAASARPKKQTSISITLAREGRVGLSSPDARSERIDTWLILPVVICLSQRLSHACLSISVIL